MLKVTVEWLQDSSSQIKRLAVQLNDAIQRLLIIEQRLRQASNMFDDRIAQVRYRRQKLEQNL